MTLIEAILLEMKTKGLDSADGINVCELIDRHNIPVREIDLWLVNTWKDINNK